MHIGANSLKEAKSPSDESSHMIGNIFNTLSMMAFHPVLCDKMKQ